VPIAQRWIWLLGSFLLAVAAAQITFRARRLPVPPNWLSDLLVWPYTPALILILRILFYVGIPLAALDWGRDVIVPRWMGLQPLLAFRGLLEAPASANELAENWANWVWDAGWAVGLGSGAGVLLAVGWWSVARKAWLNGPLTAARGSLGRTLLEAVLHEVHWAFYRNVPIVALALTRPDAEALYWGTWAGLALIGLEAVLNPYWWAALFSPQNAPMAFVRAGLAALSAVLFLKTQNLWLAILVHWGVSWGLYKLQELSHRHVLARSQE
jgi:hypothetical protein